MHTFYFVHFHGNWRKLQMFSLSVQNTSHLDERNYNSHFKSNFFQNADNSNTSY